MLRLFSAFVFGFGLTAFALTESAHFKRNFHAPSLLNVTAGHENRGVLSRSVVRQVLPRDAQKIQQPFFNLDARCSDSRDDTAAIVSRFNGGGHLVALRLIQASGINPFPTDNQTHAPSSLLRANAVKAQAYRYSREEPQRIIREEG
jgi:hypothetical protein